jgi:hypothetical protein
VEHSELAGKRGVTIALECDGDGRVEVDTAPCAACWAT